MAKKARRILSFSLTVILALAAMGLALLRVFGFQIFAVLSGSMEPEYPVGALIFVDPRCSAAQGEVITFLLDENTVVTHRIAEIVPCSDGVTRYRTKGDANETPDFTLVHPDNVIGAPIAVIPKLGYAVTWLQTRQGHIFVLCLILAAVFALFLPELFPKTEPVPKRDMAGNGRKYPH